MPAQQRPVRTRKPTILTTLRAFCAVCAVAALAAPARTSEAQDKASSQLELAYELDLNKPATHLIGVGITASQVTEPILVFAMPAWAPGRYAIYDFAKNVQEFTAVGADGQSLSWTQPDKQTWQVDARNSGGSVR